MNSIRPARVEVLRETVKVAKFELPPEALPDAVEDKVETKTEIDVEVDEPTLDVPASEVMAAVMDAALVAAPPLEPLARSSRHRQLAAVAVAAAVKVFVLAAAIGGAVWLLHAR